MTEVIEEPVEEVKEPVKAQWIACVDYKECPECHAQMRGWACRQKFEYCPMCGVKLG